MMRRRMNGIDFNGGRDIKTRLLETKRHAANAGK